jgi:hypothetical protein
MDEGYVSFGMDGGWEEKTLPGLEQEKEKYPILINNLYRFPMDVNISSTRPNPADVWLDDVQYFDDSYFSVVTETLFKRVDRGSPFGCSGMYNIFPSEKVYKPIALLQPFILMSTPHFLKALREHGYQTFHPFIDESYDSVEDDDQRFELIVSEITRLCNFTDEQWKEWMINVKPIAEHNKQHWFNLTDHRVTTDVLKYFG